MLRELELIEKLAHRTFLAASDVRVGIGDDAAILRGGESDLLLTSDMLVDGTHFRLGEVEPERIGRKALCVNLSDIAAMAGLPVAAVVSLALPRSTPDELVERLYAGICRAARQFGCPVVGGDTVGTDGPLAIAIAVLGRTEPGRAVLRSGARPGDRLLVTGSLGGSGSGKQFDFVPRLLEARYLNQHGPLRALIDVSDGLALDAYRVAKASGVRLVLRAEAIPVASHVRTLPDALDRALYDGEDFELLGVVAPGSVSELCGKWPFEAPLTEIGWVEVGRGVELCWNDGRRRSVEPLGYEHLA